MTGHTVPDIEGIEVDLRQRVALKFHHGGISVSDLEASVRWYQESLGFEVEKRFHIPQVPADVALMRRGEMRLELFRVPNVQPLPEDRRHTDRDLHTCGNKHIAFAVTDVPTTVAELRARGVDIVMWHASDFGSSAYVRDNTGNLVEFVQAPEMFAS